MSQYGKQEYWEERYTRDPEPFDWYQRFSGIREQITPHINPESKILVVGCGNSRLSEEMFEEAFQDITNIDFSQTVIQQMSEKCKDKGPNFKYLVMDVRALDFETGQFDCVIDKGTLDSILCGESSTSNAQKALNEIHRVLNPKGVYICVSYGQPEHRLIYLEKSEYDWTVQQVSIPKPTISTSIQLTGDNVESQNVHYIYICKKNGQQQQQQDKKVEQVSQQQQQQQQQPQQQQQQEVKPDSKQEQKK